MTKIPKMRRSDVAACAAIGLFVVGGTKKMKTDWIAAHRLFLGRIIGPMVNTERVLVPVVVSQEPCRIGLMDAVTGTAYSPRTGRCYSSDRLCLVSAAAAPKAAKRLLSMRADAI